MRAKKCAVCDDRRCAEIDRELRSGRSFGHVAERFRMSKTTVFRHAKRCIRESMESVDAGRGAAFDDLVSALDRQSGYLRKVLSSKERFKLQTWREWVTANTRLERLIALKIKASRRSSAAPSGTKTGEPVLSPEQIKAGMIGLCQKPETAEWLKICLYRAGHREVLCRLEDIPSAQLVEQLVASAEVRQRVMAAVLEAEAECEPKPCYSYVIPAANGDGNVREAGLTDSSETANHD
jgi:hypothetical protein